MDIESLRQYKIFEYAIFDLVIAFLGVIILSPLLSRIALKVGFKVPLASWLLWTIPFSILAHMLVGNLTPMTEKFLDPTGNYFLKLLIVVLILLGVRGVSRVER